MVVALAQQPVTVRVPKLSMLELVTVVNRRYRKTKLRRQVVPQGFCYVCSRVDPSGIFRNPNSYLFRKGFFHACEHFPKAPYTTFIGDEVNTTEDAQEEAKAKASDPRASKADHRPSISVTIKRGSPRTGSKLGSPLRRERTFSSSPSQFRKNRKAISSPQKKGLEQTYDNEGGLSLPSINKTSEHNRHSGTTEKQRNKYSVSGNTKQSKDDNSEQYTGLKSGGKLPYLKDSHFNNIVVRETPDSILTTADGRVTVVPTAEQDKSDNQSAITGLSALSKGTTPSKTSKDLDSKSISEDKVPNVDQSDRNSQTSKYDGLLNTRPYINPSDGLEPYSVAPLVKDVALTDGLYRNASSRPKAGRLLDRSIRRRDHEISDECLPDSRPESGHLRYHHRVDEDSVPGPGFEIPPTPSDQERMEMERLDAERREIEKQIAEGNVFDDASSKGMADSDDASLKLSERDTNTKSKTSQRFSGHKSFCRCLTELREESFAKTSCKTCGKTLRHRSRTRSTCSDLNLNPPATRNEAEFPLTSSMGSLSTRSRQKILYEGRDGRRDNSKAKTVSDEDYMDLDSIIHEDDGHYWSSDDDIHDGETSSYMRFKDAKPFPLVNPDIHKLVYIRALNAAQLTAKKQRELDEIDELKRLRRPNVFSYFQLLPYPRKSTSETIGIRPDESVKPKKGQYMKHIFGDVKLDDFYPGAGKFEKASKVINDNHEGPSKYNSKSTNPPPSILKEQERSSVSLKFRKQGVSFND